MVRWGVALVPAEKVAQSACCFTICPKKYFCFCKTVTE